MPVEDRINDKVLDLRDVDNDVMIGMDFYPFFLACRFLIPVRRGMWQKQWDIDDSYINGEQRVVYNEVRLLMRYFYDDPIIHIPVGFSKNSSFPPGAKIIDKPADIKTLWDKEVEINDGQVVVGQLSINF